MNWKKILGIALVAAFFVFMAHVFSMAVDNNVWLSSNTATADTTKNLCTAVNYLVGTTTITVGGHGVFHGVCVNDAGSTGTISVFNSSGTSTSPIAVIRATSTVSACKYYDVQISSGLTYTTSAPNDTTFLYQCY